MFTAKLLYHINHKISATLRADSISREVPLHGAVSHFFQGQVHMFESLGGEGEKGVIKFFRKFFLVSLCHVILLCGDTTTLILLPWMYLF